MGALGDVFDSVLSILFSQQSNAVGIIGQVHPVNFMVDRKILFIYLFILFICQIYTTIHLTQSTSEWHTKNTSTIKTYCEDHLKQLKFDLFDILNDYITQLSV